MFNLGFAVFTVFSILLSITWMHGSDGALWLIVMRIGQGVGGALIFANSSAILTDAFPPEPARAGARGQQHRDVAGAFIGLVLGGVLAPIEWRLVFLVSVPFGLSRRSGRYHSATRDRRSAGRRRSTGGATSPSPSGWSRDGRDHLRHPALRRAYDGLDLAFVLAMLPADSSCSPPSASSSSAWKSRCSISSSSGSGRSAPATSLRCSRRWAGRPAVHPDHLAAGHLAARARLRLLARRRSGRGSTCCR